MSDETCPNGRQLGRLNGQLDDIESLLAFYAEREDAAQELKDRLWGACDLVQAARDELQRAIDMVNGRGK